MEDLNLKKKTILVTGSPGFIGSYIVRRLLNETEMGTIISLDNMNDYYDVKLKKYRLRIIEEQANEIQGVQHIFQKVDIADKEAFEQVFSRYKPNLVIHLAAQAGVRYSITHPDEYISSNMVGFFNVLELCRKYPVEHLVYASSSSIYGNRNAVPFSVEDKSDTPESLYAATKKADELMAYTYAKLYHIPSTGLRFFTVYGPAGRPDMFYFSTLQKYMNGETIRVFNHGNMMRDFTYIDDITEGIIRVLKKPPQKEVPYSIYNIGFGSPVKLLDFLDFLQQEIKAAGLVPPDFDFEAHRDYIDMQAGDVLKTYADMSAFERDFGPLPKTDYTNGLHAFIKWFVSYNEER